MNVDVQRNARLKAGCSCHTVVWQSRRRGHPGVTCFDEYHALLLVAVLLCLIGEYLSLGPQMHDVPISNPKLRRLPTPNRKQLHRSTLFLQGS